MPYATSNIRDTIFGGSSQKLMKGGGNVAFNLFEMINDKKTFLVKIFATLITQLGITYYVMMNYQPPKKGRQSLSLFQFFLLFIFQITLIGIIAFVPMHIFFKLFLFSIFSSTFGVMLAYFRQFIDPRIIQMALVSAASIFGMMFLLGLSLLLFGIRLSFGFGFILWIILLLLIIVRIVSLFTSNHSSTIKGFSMFTIILFAVYIIYDTNRILQKDYYGDFVTGAIDYYLDILNIFVSLLNFNSR